MNLVVIEFNKTQFFIKSDSTQEIVWLSLRYLQSKNKSPGYLINTGDVLKMGRIKFKVREIKFESKICEVNLLETVKDNIVENNMDLNSFYKKKSSTLLRNKTSKRTCRICYCDDKEVDSPLLNPCNCSGGVKYIHFTCLQQWLKSRCIIRSISNESCIMYTLKQVECEICKQVLPDYVKYQDKLYEIWEFVKPSYKNYVSLETLITDKNSVKTLYIVNLDNKNKLSIGRSHDADLRISDISVSRFHAHLVRYGNNTLRLEDNNSKFGTLVLIQHPRIPIAADMPLPLQTGRTLLSVYMKQPWNLFNCFSCGDTPRGTVDYSLLNLNHIDMTKIYSVKIQNDNFEEDDDEENLNTNNLNHDVVTSHNNDLELGNNINVINNEHNYLTDDNQFEAHVFQEDRKMSNKLNMNHLNLNYIESKEKEKDFSIKETNVILQPVADFNINLNTQKCKTIRDQSITNNVTSLSLLNLKYSRQTTQPINKPPTIFNKKLNLSPLLVNSFKQYEEDLFEQRLNKEKEIISDNKENIKHVKVVSHLQESQSQIGNRNEGSDEESLSRVKGGTSFRIKNGMIDSSNRKNIQSEFSSVVESERVVPNLKYNNVNPNNNSTKR